MAEVAPFKGIFYNPEKIKDLSKVVSPPYDVISPHLQNKLYLRHPYNIARIDFGKIFPRDGNKNNRYTRANFFLHSWLREKILIQDKSPAIYLSAQNYRYKGSNFARWGFIARLRLKDDDSVLAHEKTSAHHKNDRFRLIKEVKANLNPVFTLFHDDSGLMPYLKRLYAKRKPFADFAFEGIENRLWRIEDASLIRKIIKIFSLEKIFIADGHHRFEASVAYKKYCEKINPSRTGKEDYNYAMMYFSALEDKALKIFPTHRLINILPENLEEKLSRYFDLIACPGKKELFSLMEKFGRRGYAFGMYLGKKRFYLLKLRSSFKIEKIMRTDNPLSWKKLDVSVLHTLIIEKIFGIANADFKSIAYTQDESEAISQVTERKFKVALFLNPTRPRQVREVALDRARMPHKSTYFYPKLLSGALINPV